ncbi:MAG: sodium-independent anion transporter, partial [Rikenellaceae bacterium]
VTEVSVARSSLDLSAESETPSEEVLDLPKGVEVYQIDGPFFFGIATKLESAMQGVGERAKVRIVRMRRVPFMDSTGVHNLESLVRMSQEAGVVIILSGVNPKVRETLNKAGFVSLLGEQFICDNIQDAIKQANHHLALVND